MKSGEQAKLDHIRKNIIRLIWGATSAAIGIGLALWFVGTPSSSFLLASLGGSTVFPFGLTAAAAGWSRLIPGMNSCPVNWILKSPHSIL